METWLLRTQKNSQGGAELLEFKDRSGNSVALCMTKYYSWELLRHQLYFLVHKNPSGEPDALSLTSLDALTEKNFGAKKDYSMAVELAYNFVDPEKRGQKLGALAFNHRIFRAGQIKTEKPKFLFTMSRGAYLAEKIGQGVLETLLHIESIKNGLTSDREVKITGIEVPLEIIINALHLPRSFDFQRVHNESQAIAYLAKKSGMQELGIYKDLSPIFAAELE